MNKASFLSIVRETSRISEQDAEALEQLVVNFPYCQTAHLLIAKAAYDRGSMLSNQKLKKAAIYATNRQLLKKLIYTSDATVALHPLPPEETVAEMPEKVSGPKTSEALPLAETMQTASETAASEPEIAHAKPEPEKETPETEPATSVQETAPGAETGKEETSAEQAIIIPEEAILAEEVSIAENLPHEPVITAEQSTSAHAPELHAEPAQAENLKEILPEEVSQETATAESALPAEAEEAAEISEPEELTLAETGITEQSEISEAQAEDALETVGKTEEKPEAQQNNLSEPAIKTSQPLIPEETEEETLAESTEKLPDFQVLPQNDETTLQDVADLHELVLTDEPHLVPYKVSALHDDLLQETLASFDQYLFKPEKETEEEDQREDLKVVYPENEIEAIYRKDSIGYWMSSSRLGECLQLKDEFTTSQPIGFQPELILEYTKTHELEKQLKPAPDVVSQQIDIIDQFLKLSPRLKPGGNIKIRTEAQEDLSQKSSKINKNLASENFANILIQQGKIKKAIKIYEHLILKIPEKKAYFVAQIEKLKNQE